MIFPTHEWYSALARLSASCLVQNYRIIQSLVPSQRLLPMLKANAYGHGAEWVARQLVALPKSNLYGFGLATLDEGVQLRTQERQLDSTALLIFSGATPWSEDIGNLCVRYQLTPVLFSETDWKSFFEGQWFKKLPYELLFNTGMNRLGLSIDFASVILANMSSELSKYHPKGVFSHFAMSETPSSSLTQKQLKNFSKIKDSFQTFFPGTIFHLANSGGIWNHSSFQWESFTGAVRLGLGLYGIVPWSGAPSFGLNPVLNFEAKVIAKHLLQEGDQIGYGGIFQVKKDTTVTAAIIGAGYADGVLRRLSSGEVSGGVWLDGKWSRFLGAISMDLCAVECSPTTEVGGWAQFLGPSIDPWKQAQAAGTIPYELLTAISSRVKRVYES